MRFITFLSVLTLFFIVGSVRAALYNDPCVVDPTMNNCTNYTLPDDVVIADMVNLCNAMADMPGCGIWTLCQQTTLEPQKYCNNFSLVKLICEDGMSMMGGCANYNSMCQNGSVVEECATETLPDAPTWSGTRADVKSICAEMPGMTGCANCTADLPRCDLFNVYSGLCSEMPFMSQCGQWEGYCNHVPTWPTCVNFVPEPPASPEPNCIDTPTSASCASFELPLSEIKRFNDMLCTAMDNMPGCTIRNVCNTTASLIGSTYCGEFSIYKTICTDMPTMMGCGNYTSMCATHTVVHQCSIPAAPVPSTMTTFGYIKSICTEPGMLMDACYRCEGKAGPGTSMNCDLLDVYSDLCFEMPGMSQCTGWTAYCKVLGDWPFCTGTNADGTVQPVMRMWFHQSISDYVLFFGWVPQNELAYTGTWFIILAFSILFETLKFLRSRIEMKFNERIEEYNKEEAKKGADSDSPDCEHCGQEDTPKNTGCLGAPRFFFTIDVPRAFLQSIEVIWSLLLMLVAMTYNVGLFFAIPAGAFIGTLIFGRFMAYKPPSSCH